MREIKAIKVDNEVISLGMRNTIGFNHKTIAQIKEFHTNDPRNGFNVIGYYGLDEDGKLIFEIMTNSAVVIFK